jgi:hypothetical protein
MRIPATRPSIGTIACITRNGPTATANSCYHGLWGYHYATPYYPYRGCPRGYGYCYPNDRYRYPVAKHGIIVR